MEEYSNKIVDAVLRNAPKEEIVSLINESKEAIDKVIAERKTKENGKR